MVKKNLKRDSYEYLGKTEDIEKIIDFYIANGKNYGDNPLINKFVECAVIDNARLFFIPNSVTVMAVNLPENK